MGGDADLAPCGKQGLWGKVLRLAGAHAAAFAEGRRLVAADADWWVGSPELGSGGWPIYFETPAGGAVGERCNSTALGLPERLAGVGDSSVWAAPGQQELGWEPWAGGGGGGGGGGARVVLWSACPHQNIRYRGSAPGDQHTNDFWPLAPQGPPPGHSAHSLTSWQAAFLADLLARPTPLTRVSGHAEHIGTAHQHHHRHHHRHRPSLSYHRLPPTDAMEHLGKGQGWRRKEARCGLTDFVISGPCLLLQAAVESFTDGLGLVSPWSLDDDGGGGGSSYPMIGLHIRRGDKFWGGVGGLPISPHIAPYRPISPHIAPYRPISPHLAPYRPISPHLAPPIAPPTPAGPLSSVVVAPRMLEAW
jgi:hypothetical protein